MLLQVYDDVLSVDNERSFTVNENTISLKVTNAGAIMDVDAVVTDAAGTISKKSDYGYSQVRLDIDDNTAVVIERSYDDCWNDDGEWYPVTNYTLFRVYICDKK